MSEIDKYVFKFEGETILVGSFEETLKEMEATLKSMRQESYSDGEWPYDFDTSMFIFKNEKIIAKLEECDVIEKPDDLDEDEYSDSLSLSFHNVDRYIDYRVHIME